MIIQVRRHRRIRRPRRWYWRSGLVWGCLWRSSWDHNDLISHVWLANGIICTQQRIWITSRSCSRDEGFNGWWFHPQLSPFSSDLVHLQIVSWNVPTVALQPAFLHQKRHTSHPQRHRLVSRFERPSHHGSRWRM